MAYVKVFSRKHSGTKSNLVILLGLGFIGSTINHSLLENGFSCSEFYFSWADISSMQQAFAKIREGIEKPHFETSDVTGIDLVWAAGAGSFYSSEHDFVDENFFFHCFLEFGLSLSGIAKTGFHYLSSAGGMFEGQKHVSLESVPNPLRPYGTNKFVQEKMCRDADSAINIHIYRPSSVYGYSSDRGRAGLITILIKNGLLSRPTTIFGDLSTLRDFIYVQDVATFIVEKILAPAPNTYFLVSGKPCSILEIIELVQRVIKRRVIYQLNGGSMNALSMSFSDRLKPRNLKTTGLLIGISQTELELRRSGFANLLGKGVF